MTYLGPKFDAAINDALKPVIPNIMKLADGVLAAGQGGVVTQGMVDNAETVKGGLVELGK